MSGLRMVGIGDMHAHPGYDNKRFEIAGQFCAEFQPDVIIQIGDWPDVLGINDHLSKLEFEGVRWKHDVECTNDSLADFMRPIRARKKKMPRRVLTKGNHCNRVDKFIHQNPQFEGAIGFHQFNFEREGWEVINFLRYKEIAGFRFVHYMQGRNGRPVSLAANYKKRGVSTVVGHSHVAAHHIHPFETHRIHGIDLGCLVHLEMPDAEDWSHPSAHEYWRGLWTFENAANGDADISMIRAQTLGC